MEHCDRAHRYFEFYSGAYAVGLSVAREREHGTFDQLLVSPYRPFEILLAKATPPIVIGIAQTFIVVLFAVFWFDIPMRG